MFQNPEFHSSQEVADQLQSNVNLGLTSKNAENNLLKYGKNQIKIKEEKKVLQLLLSQFLHPIIYILLIATLIAFLNQNYLEGLAILIVILITIGIGFFMELSAITSLEKLRKLSESNARIIRDGKIKVIKTIFLVPGDIILVEAGNMVPADARIIESDNLMVKEAALTGESFPVAKTTDSLPKNTPFTQQINMLFNGTAITSGSGKAIIVATGSYTQLGKIHEMGTNVHQKQTPLEKKLSKLSTHLIWLTLFFCIAIVGLGYIRGHELILMIQTGIALAVASIPEGLPIVSTIALAQGMLRLSKKNVIIKNLEAVQTLGATNIICTDKTGTLTEDHMQVYMLAFEDVILENVPQNKIAFEDHLKKKTTLEKIMKASVLCNNIDLKITDKHGDSIDFALMEFALSTGYPVAKIKKENPETKEIPFNPDVKMMTTVHKNAFGYAIYAKGAFEAIEKHCMTIALNGKSEPFIHKQDWYEIVDKMASQGLRTLAFACKKTKRKPKENTILKNLTFLGVIGFLDPPRNDVAETISVYKRADIHVIMITGDHPGTSKKIAEEIGLLDPHDQGNKVVLGDTLQNLDTLSDSMKILLNNAVIFARVTPEQKLNLITFLQNSNNIVGMLGDGINDIPALKKADIGISMGIRGKEAARDVADVILKDDKFASIAMAIHQGRVIYQNIKQFVVYLLSCNIAEIISVGLASIFNLPSPLLPLQILFLNLITDIFPALALGLGKGADDIMQQKPRKADEPILNTSMWFSISIFGLCITASVLGVTIYAYYILRLDSETINNMAFYTIIFAQLLNVFNMPKVKSSLFKNEVTLNKWIWLALLFCILITLLVYFIPPMAKALSLVRLSWIQLKIVLIFGMASLIIAQTVKRIWRIDYEK